MSQSGLESRLTSLCASMPVGRVAPLQDERGMMFWIRWSPEALFDLPRLVLVDLRLGVWDFSGVLATVLLVRIEKEPRFTYSLWLDCSSPAGVRVVQNMARQQHAFVTLFSENQHRCLRTRNSIALRCHRVVTALQRRPAWTGEEYQAAVQRVRKRHRSSVDLWLAVRNEAFPL